MWLSHGLRVLNTTTGAAGDVSPHSLLAPEKGGHWPESWAVAISCYSHLLGYRDACQDASRHVVVDASLHPLKFDGIN